jgi:hypothetical protein
MIVGLAQVMEESREFDLGATRLAATPA